MRVPHTNILGAVNKGFAIANDRLTRQRIPYAAGCIGVAVKAHEMALEYVPQRETFGAPLSSRQAIQWMLVDNEVDIKQATWLTLEAAHKADLGEPFRKEAAMARGQGNIAPVYIDRALGSEMWDVEGGRYIDFGSGIAVCNTGHMYPKVKAAVQD
jgi:alkylation response protein AidB-like acyl-CoA dehydrogenase